MRAVHEKRRVYRYDCSIPCTIHFLLDRSAKSQTATMLNVSTEGAMLRCETPLPRESAVLVTMIEPQRVSLGAQVVHVADVLDGGCVLGVRAVEDWPSSWIADTTWAGGTLVLN